MKQLSWKIQMLIRFLQAVWNDVNINHDRLTFCFLMWGAKWVSMQSRPHPGQKMSESEGRINRDCLQRACWAWSIHPFWNPVRAPGEHFHLLEISPVGGILVGRIIIVLLHWCKYKRVSEYSSFCRAWRKVSIHWWLTKRDHLKSSELYSAVILVK